jgi:hypothetical protein
MFHEMSSETALAVGESRPLKSLIHIRACAYIHLNQVPEYVVRPVLDPVGELAVASTIDSEWIMALTVQIDKILNMLEGVLKASYSRFRASFATLGYHKLTSREKSINF